MEVDEAGKDQPWGQRHAVNTRRANSGARNQMDGNRREQTRTDENGRERMRIDERPRPSYFTALQKRTETDENRREWTRGNQVRAVRCKPCARGNRFMKSLPPRTGEPNGLRQKGGRLTSQRVLLRSRSFLQPPQHPPPNLPLLSAVFSFLSSSKHLLPNTPPSKAHHSLASTRGPPCLSSHCTQT